MSAASPLIVPPWRRWREHANDYSPAAAQVRCARAELPVVLIHGTWANSDRWGRLASRLLALGHRVYTPEYGKDPSSALGALPRICGTGDITASVHELAEKIHRILEVTQAPAVHLVGHSQGGLLIRALTTPGALPTDPDAPALLEGVVRSVVTLAGTNHGTTAGGLQSLVGILRSVSGDLPVTQAATVIGQAGPQQLTTSPLLRHLNTRPDTIAGIDYTVVVSRNDFTSTPYRAAFLEPVPGARVTNIAVQDISGPWHVVGHDGLMRDRLAIDLVARALGPEGWTTVNKLVTLTPQLKARPAGASEN